MIQQIGHIEKKENWAIFILFIPKWWKIKDPKKIKNQKSKTKKGIKTAKNAQLLDKNKLIVKISLLNQILNTNKNFSNAESVVDLANNLEADFNYNNVN